MHAGDLKRTTNEFNYLKRDTYNAIVDSLKDKNLTQPGYSFADRQQAIRPARNNRQYFYFNCDVPLLERSIFGIHEGYFGYNNPPILNAVNITAETGVSPWGYFTNIQAYEPTDEFGLCVPISFYEPTLLQISDLEFPPLLGYPCGPDNNPDNWGISGFNSYGLICISDVSDPSSAEPDTVWCIRTPDFNICGIIIDNDIPAWEGGENQLPMGLVQLESRLGSNINTLINMLGPGVAGSTDLILPVFNTSTTTTFKEGTFVKCISVTGVGLVIIDSANLLYGRAKTGVGFRRSGLINIYSGDPGEETWDEETEYEAFNQLSAIVENEWVFLTPSGGNPPYYIVSSECSGKILGKTQNTIFAGSANSVGVDVYTGTSGSETDSTYNITAAVNLFHGVIPKDTWVICNFVGQDATQGEGTWYVVHAQRSNILFGKITYGQSAIDLNNGYAPVDTDLQVTLLDKDRNPITDNVGNVQVTARAYKRPVLASELVTLEWVGDKFIISSGELDGGFYGQAISQVSNGSSGKFRVLAIANSNVSAANGILADTQEGQVEAGRKVFIFGNRSGFHVASKSCQ